MFSASKCANVVSGFFVGKQGSLPSDALISFEHPVESVDAPSSLPAVMLHAVLQRIGTLKDDLAETVGPMHQDQLVDSPCPHRSWVIDFR